MNKIFLKMKLRNKLLVSYLFACLVPLFISCFIIYHFSYTSLEETSMEFAYMYNSQIVKSLDEFMEKYDVLAKSALIDNEVLATIHDKNDNSASQQLDVNQYLNKIMMRLMILNPNIQEIMLITAQNELYQFSSISDTVNFEVLHSQMWLQEFIESEESIMMTSVHDRIYYDINKEGAVLTIGRNILDYSGSYFGVLLFDVDPTDMFKMNDDFLNARNKYNINITVTNSLGELLYDSDVISGKITWEEAEARLLNLEENKDDFIVISNETSKGNLHVNTIIEKDKLLSNINKISYITLVAISFCTIVVVIISISLSSTITKPIEVLQENISKVKDGQFEIINQRNVGGEIEDLIQNHNNMVQQIENLINEVYVAEIKQKNAKFLALQAQINPHMLFNTLESIRMKALIKNEDEIAEMIKILSKMFRVTLENSTSPITIKEELDFVENYVKLLNMRYKDKFILDVNMDDEILSTSITSMVLQPIVENCIEHGFKGHCTILNILIEGKSIADGDVLILIKDDGKGMSDEEIIKINKHINSNTFVRYDSAEGSTEKRISIGLKNIAERIKLYYGDDYYLKINSNLEEGLSVEIKIPMYKTDNWRENVSNIDS